MLQQLPQNPIFCRFLLKKNIFDEKKFKKNQKIKIGQFSISAWLEARFSSYDQKTVNLGKQVYTLTTGGFCTVQLCLLFIDGATGCFYLPSTFDPSSLTLNEQLRRGSWWQAIYTFFRCRIWIGLQIHWSRTGSVGIFPSRHNGGKFPQTQFCSSESGSQSRSCTWKRYKYPAISSPLLSCSLSVKEERSKVEGR